MTGGGAPGAAGIIKCLQCEPALNITVADAAPEVIGRYLAIDFEKIPMATDAGFIDVILSICRKKNIHIILPLVTKELFPLSLHAKDLELSGAKVLVSPVEALQIANNKSRLYEFMQSRNLDVPRFKTVKNIFEFREAVSMLNYPSKEVCFKPSVSNGSRGFRIITDKINELDLLLNHKPYSAYINLQDSIRILSSGEFPELLVSEYLPGPEYSIDCLANNGKPVLVVPRLRTKMLNGISISGEIVRDETIIEYCKKIITELQLHGNIGIQVKQSSAGKFLLLEINPRVQGTISAVLGAGVNLPVLAIKQELGLPITRAETEVKWGTKFSRYWSEIFY